MPPAMSPARSLSSTAGSRSTVLSATRVIEVLVEGLDHPEGVCWEPRDGMVWAGGEAGQLYRVDVDARTVEEVARAPGFVHGLAADGLGRIAFCCGEDGLICVLEDGEVRVLLDGLRFPNYP